ncbi:hypothetical protein [Pseudaestuariivita sp.]|uniref:hypothetical protein n=1 Tax=Pseudaestuariivita sp. TaxID=2211669 RepID=UPI00405965DA
MPFRAAFATILAAATLIATALIAHEVRPAVGDLEATAGGSARLVLTLNGEALVAGVDLDAVTDTNDSAQADAFDAARALPPAALEEALRGVLAAPPLALVAGESILPLTLEALTVGEIGNVELPRDTVVTFTAPVPASADALQLSWPAGWGALILRQQGVEEPYTGFLAGGQTSEPFAIPGGTSLVGNVLIWVFVAAFLLMLVSATAFIRARRRR